MLELVPSLNATREGNLIEMTFVPYTLQTVLSEVPFEPASPPTGAVSPTTSTPRTLFARQRTSPIGESKSPPTSPQGVGSRFRSLTTSGKQGIEAVEAWGNVSIMRTTFATIRDLTFIKIDNNLYVGTSDGFVLHYIVEEQADKESV